MKRQLSIGVACLLFGGCLGALIGCVDPNELMWGSVAQLKRMEERRINEHAKMSGKEFLASREAAAGEGVGKFLPDAWTGVGGLVALLGGGALIKRGQKKGEGPSRAQPEIDEIKKKVGL